MKPLSILFRRKSQAGEVNQNVTHEIVDHGGSPLDLAPKDPSKPADPVTNESRGIPDELTFELGDFLKRIPVKFLKHGDPDPKRTLRFPVAEISAMIAQGKTQIPLTEIISRFPDIFRENIEGAEATLLYFPWQKLARLVQSARPVRSNARSGEGAPFFEPPFANRAAPKKSLTEQREPVFPASEKTDVTTPRETTPATANINSRKMAWFNRGRPNPEGGVPVPTAAPLAAPIAAVPEEKPEPKIQANAPEMAPLTLPPEAAAALAPKIDVAQAEESSPELLPKSTGKEPAAGVAEDGLDDHTKERAAFNARLVKVLTAEIEELKRLSETAVRERDAATAQLAKSKAAQKHQATPAKVDVERLLTDQAARLTQDFEKQLAEVSQAGEKHRERGEEWRAQIERAGKQKVEHAENLEKLNAELRTKLATQETEIAKAMEEGNARTQVLGDQLAEGKNRHGELSKKCDELRAQLEQNQKQAVERAENLEKEGAELQAKLKAQEQEKAQAVEEKSALTRTLEGQLAETEKQRERLSQNITEARERHAIEIAAVREELAAAVRNTAQGKSGEMQAMEKLRTERDAAARSLEESRAAHETQLAALRQELSVTTGKHEKLHAQLLDEAKVRADEIAKLQTGHQTLTASRNEAVAGRQAKEQEHTALSRELTALRAQLQTASHDRDQARTELSGGSQSRAQEIEKLRTERDTALQARDAATAAALAQSEANELRLAGISTDRDETMARVKALRRQLTQAAEDRTLLVKEKDDALADIKRTADFQQPVMAAVTAEHDALQGKIGALSKELDSVRAELEAVRQKHAGNSTQLTAEREALRQKLSEATHSQSDQLQQLRRELELAQKFRTEVTAQLAAAREENKRAFETQRQQLDDTTRKLAQRDAEKRDLQKRVESLNAERERLTVEKSQALQRIESRTRELEAQVRSLTEKNSEASKGLQAVRQSLSESEARARELSAIRADRDTLRQQIANIHTTQTEQIRSLEKELETVRREFASVDADLKNVRSELESRTASLTGERDKAQAERAQAVAERDAAYALPQVRPVTLPPPVIGGRL